MQHAHYPLIGRRHGEHDSEGVQDVWRIGLVGAPCMTFSGNYDGSFKSAHPVLSLPRVQTRA
jgi:hypothetical protein